MTDTLLIRDDITMDEALQQSVGELGRGQRWRFCLVMASSAHSFNMDSSAFVAARAGCQHALQLLGRLKL